MNPWAALVGLGGLFVDIRNRGEEVGKGGKSGVDLGGVREKSEGRLIKIHCILSEIPKELIKTFHFKKTLGKTNLRYQQCAENTYFFKGL